MDGAVETSAPAAEPAAPAAEPKPSAFLAYAAEEDRKDRLRAGLPAGDVEPPKADAPVVEKPKAAEPQKATPPAADDDQPAVDASGKQIRDSDGTFISKRQQRINDRIAEGVRAGIATERAAREAAEKRALALETEAAQLRSGQQPPKPAAEPAKPAVVEDKEPAFEDFQQEADPFLAYYRALGKYEARQEFKRLQGETEAQTRAREARTADEKLIDAHLDREQAILATVPDYPAKVQKIREIIDQGFEGGSQLARALLESPVSEKLLLHFAEHPEDFDRIGRLGVTNLLAASRELGKLEVTLSTPASRAADTPAPAAPPKKTVTSAPEPPTTLGTRPAEPANASHAALAGGNFLAFAAEEDKKDLARLRR